ncbi:hypothetical protein BGX31_003505 [Mortierella sp. GBA43]|nr:hypothetical protein BGX31_003505 [Mortierella sp. GBA43]
MAPRTRKNASARQRNGNGNGNPESRISVASSSSSASNRKRSSQSTATTSKRRSTPNATNLTSQPIQDQDMSEDSDFDTSPKARVSTSSSSKKPTAIVNKRSAEESLSSSSTTTKRDQKKVKQEEDSDVDMKTEEPEARFDTPDSASDGGSEFHMEEGSEDEDEWEEVTIPALVNEVEDNDSEEEPSGPWMYNPVEIVFDRPLQDIKKQVETSKGKGITKEERMIRVLIHQTHLLCLLANGRLRNRWICHPKLSSIALSLVPDHIAGSVQKVHDDPVKEVNALQVLALWWRDSFVVTGPGIQYRELLDPDVVGYEAAIPVSNEECLKRRKHLQRRLLNRKGSADICSQLFTGICRSLGLKARLVESLQACSFKITQSKDQSTSAANGEDNPPGESSPRKKGKRKKTEEILDESDTTRGSRVVIHTPHRLTKKPSNVPPNHKKADGYIKDVTRRYTSAWGSVTKKLRVQPAGREKFDWWAQTMSRLMNPDPTIEEGIEEEELLQAEVSERMPTRIGDFNNHPMYALERHLKKYEVLHPKLPVLGHVRGEAVYPRSCVKEVRSKENWLKKGRVIKDEEVIPVKWVKSHAATIYQVRLRQQMALSGSRSESVGDDEDSGTGQARTSGTDDKVALFGEWQTEAYQPPWVVDGKVPRNQYGRQDVFTPEMVPIGGTHLKGRKIGQVARLLGVDYVEAVTGFEFQSRRSVPVIDGIIVPTESAELVLDAYQEVVHQQHQEAFKKKRTQVLKRWRLVIKSMLLHTRLMEEYGPNNTQLDDDEDDWAPEDDDGSNDSSHAMEPQMDVKEMTRDNDQTSSQDAEQEDSGGGFMSGELFGTWNKYHASPLNVDDKAMSPGCGLYKYM